MKNQMWSVIFVSVVSFASQRPEIPAPGEDLVLTGGKTVADYFASRTQSDSNCNRDLKASKEKYHEEKEKLLKLINSKAKSSELDSQEKQMNQARDTLIQKLEECGECATRPIEHRTVYAPSGTQRWYIADGSCYLPALNLSPSQLQEVFERATQRMLDNSTYPKQKGGIPSILLFDRVDEATGKVIPGGPVEDPSFLISLSVKGPSFAGIVSAFNYFIKNDVEKRSQDGLQETVIRFNQFKAPKGYQPPSKIYDVTAGGNQTAAFVRNISEVQGLWYFNNQGYFRYYTAADFGISLSLADSFARKILLEALFSTIDESSSK